MVVAEHAETSTVTALFVLPLEGMLLRIEEQVAEQVAVVQDCP
jgi:hypothetical protein